MESSQYLATHQENEKLLCTAGNSFVKVDFIDVHLDTPDPVHNPQLTTCHVDTSSMKPSVSLHKFIYLYLGFLVDQWSYTFSSKSGSLPSL